MSETICSRRASRSSNFSGALPGSALGERRRREIMRGHFAVRRQKGNGIAWRMRSQIPAEGIKFENEAKRGQPALRGAALIPFAPSSSDRDKVLRLRLGGVMR